MLPKIIKDRVDLEVSPQLCVSLFPEDQGQPKIDIVQVKLKQLEGNTTDLFLTPCEALELSAALNQVVQFYLFNQEQYREEILKPRERLVAKRSKAIPPKLMKKALEVFEDKNQATNWFNTPLKILGGKKPLDCPVKEVSKILNRLEHGVFS